MSKHPDPGAKPLLGCWQTLSPDLWEFSGVGKGEEEGEKERRMSFVVGNLVFLFAFRFGSMSFLKREEGREGGGCRGG